jgi:hypothetical protein
VSFSGGGRLRLQRDGVDYRLEQVPIENCLATYDRPAKADQAWPSVPSVAGE